MRGVDDRNEEISEDREKTSKRSKEERSSEASDGDKRQETRAGGCMHNSSEGRDIVSPITAHKAAKEANYVEKGKAQSIAHWVHWVHSPEQVVFTIAQSIAKSGVLRS